MNDLFIELHEFGTTYSRSAIRKGMECDNVRDYRQEHH